MKHLLENQPTSSTQQYHIQVAETAVTLPATIIKGGQLGRTLLITAGIHGSEYPGIEAAKQLIRKIDPSRLAGNVLIFPCINQRAFFERRAFVNPADGKNINRCFPGNPLGTESEKIAYTLEKEAFSTADFYLDFHSGDLSEKLNAFVFVPGVGEPAALKKARQHANCLNLPFGVISKGRTEAYNRACAMGVPALLIERGGFGECHAQEIEGFVDDAARIMADLKMLEQPLEDKKELPLLTEVCYVHSPSTGLWTPTCEISDLVQKGQLLGVIEDFFGNVLKEVFAEQEGQILYQAAGLPINEGESLIAYGL
ncbi:hypothetical protein IGI39_003535 [Enterococcus sp. AZ135]|uniref:M14 family metallopeptidase n=1 Tax=unclassified Enterococcus TaxID=2608891 RepID=UPI003F295415